MVGRYLTGKWKTETEIAVQNVLAGIFFIHVALIRLLYGLLPLSASY